LRGDRGIDSYIQAVPGENLPAKPLGTKTWRKPGQIYVDIKEKKKRRSERHVKENKEIKKVFWRRIYPVSRNVGCLN
jgi:hypothetical protein